MFIRIDILVNMREEVYPYQVFIKNIFGFASPFSMSTGFVLSDRELLLPIRIYIRLSINESLADINTQ